MSCEAVNLISPAASTEPAPPAKASLRPVTIALAAARTLEVGSSGTALRLRGPDGAIELSVRITAEGPVLHFSSASIEVAETKSFKLDVEQLELRSKDMRVEVTGDVQQTVAGNSVTHCAGRHELQADAVTLVSHGDTMVLDATHDLAINGERVLINC